MAKYVGKRIIPRHAGAWDKTKSYEPLTIVLAPNGDSYTSCRDVPAGVELSNPDYWSLAGRFNAQLKETYDKMTEDMSETLRQMNEGMTSTLRQMNEDFDRTHTEISTELKETTDGLKQHVSDSEAAVKERLTAAKQSVDESRADMDAAVKNLTARLDANVTASTQPNGDYAAELVDMRTDSEGEVHPSAGAALRSSTEGLPVKLYASEFNAIKERPENTVELEAKGPVYHGRFSYNGEGYIGFFFGFFGEKENYAGKKYRIVFKAEKALNMMLLLTNAPKAWGSWDGSVKSARVGELSLTEENGYYQRLEIDFGAEELSSYLESLPEDHKLYFCLQRQDKIPDYSANFYLYGYEVEETPGFFWKYVSPDDAIMLLRQEIEDARNDGTPYPSLSAVLRAHGETKRMLEAAATDSRGTPFTDVKERLDNLDSIARVRVAVNDYRRPRDNINNYLDFESGSTGAQKSISNVAYTLHIGEYTALEKPAWGSLHFWQNYSGTIISQLGADDLCMEVKLEGIDEATKGIHDGKTVSLEYYINNAGSWAAPVNKRRLCDLIVGTRTVIPLPKEEVENVLATGKELHLLFAGNRLDNDIIRELNHIRITVSLLDRSIPNKDGVYSGYAEAAEYAQVAGLAAKANQADEAEEARHSQKASHSDTADYADNFFLESADHLLNVAGRRQSPGMDTLDIPEKPPYEYACNRQSVKTSNTTMLDNGFSTTLCLELTLSASSDQVKNQGYVKLLRGVMPLTEIMNGLKNGWKDFCYCALEDYTDYPEGSEEGNYFQHLLISVYPDGEKNTIICSIRPTAAKQLGSNLALTLWRVTVEEEKMALYDQAMAQENPKIGWCGIWNTRQYEGEQDVIWKVLWYWQDCAFTDGSYTDDEMLTFFQRKYAYWASMMTHPGLVRQFAAVAEEQGKLETAQTELAADMGSLSAELDNLRAEMQGRQGYHGIVCWGDSLTAGGGWTQKLSELSGLTVYNGGTGGENARTIAARQGADAMTINGVTIPAACEPVTLAVRASDMGILTEWGYKVTPLLQGGAHVNPVMIGDVEGTLKWTGANYADTTGVWTFTRSKAGEAVVIDRPTAIRTAFDRLHNRVDEIMVLFIGQNGGYKDVSDLIRTHRLMIDHFKGKEYLVLGLSSGTEVQRKDYEAAMKEAFGRRFVSLREYLAAPVYEGTEIVSCYGLKDAGLAPTEADIERIKVGQVPQTLLMDSVHYTPATKAVIGRLVYKKMKELGILA